jgi:hypothetical protein
MHANRMYYSYLFHDIDMTVDLNRRSVWLLAKEVKFRPINQHKQLYILRSLCINSSPCNEAKLIIWTAAVASDLKTLGSNCNVRCRICGG